MHPGSFINFQLVKPRFDDFKYFAKAALRMKNSISFTRRVEENIIVFAIL